MPPFPLLQVLSSICSLLANPNPGIYYILIFCFCQLSFIICDSFFFKKEKIVKMDFSFLLVLDFTYEPEIAHIYKTDRSRYEAIAREWTKQYASE